MAPTLNPTRTAGPKPSPSFAPAPATADSPTGG